jgi:transcriptional regulator with XRE-family HTH domain
MGWPEVGKAVLNRRVELGMRKRGQLAGATGLTVKTLGELERGERTNFEPATIALVEQALRWPPGAIDAILSGRGPNPAVAFPSGDQPPAFPIPDPIAELLDEYRLAGRPERDALLEQVRRISEWARYRRER